MIAVNAGVGPATIRSVEVLVDGKAEPDWIHVFKAVAVLPGNLSFSTFKRIGRNSKPGYTAIS